MTAVRRIYDVAKLGRRAGSRGRDVDCGLRARRPVADTGNADHRWQFLPDADGCFRIRNTHSGKLLRVGRMSTADSAIVVQFGDTGSPDHLWRLLPA